MNDFFVKNFSKSKKNAIYSPLTDEMELYEYSPRKLSSPSNKFKLLKFNRKLFPKKHKSFKMSTNRKHPDSKSRMGKMKTLLNTIQNKVQTWSQVRIPLSTDKFH